MSNEQLVIELKKRKRWILPVIILIFILSWFVQSVFNNEFQGTVEFSLNSGALMDISIYEPSHPEKMYFDFNDISRIYAVIYSTEILDSVSEKFNLRNHYNIDSLQPFHYERMVQVLTSKIQLKAINKNLVALTFTDKDKHLAADMANEIVRQVNIYFKRKYKSLLQNKIKLYETIMADVSAKDSVLKTEIRDVLAEIKPLSGTVAEEKEKVYSLRKRIDFLIDQLYYNKDNYLGTYKLYQSALKATDELDINVLTVLKKALPDIGKSISYKILMCLGISFFGFCVLVLLFYIYLLNRHLIKLFFSKS